MTNEQREKIYQWVMACGLQDVLFYKAEDTEGKEVVMDRFENFEAFAWHVEQEEREACAQIAEYKLDNKGLTAPDSPKEWWNYACQNIRDAIRARGQA